MDPPSLSGVELLAFPAAGMSAIGAGAALLFRWKPIRTTFKPRQISHAELETSVTTTVVRGGCVPAAALQKFRKMLVIHV